MFFLSGIILAFFLEILLLSKKGKTKADRILAAWLIIIAFNLLDFYMQHTGVIFKYPWLLGIPLPLPLLHGPFLFYYVSHLTGQIPKYKYSWILHGLPFAISLILISTFIFRPDEIKLAVYKGDNNEYNWFSYLNYASIVSSGLGYFFVSNLKLIKHKKNIKEAFSTTDKVNLNWLRYLTYGIGSIYLISAFFDEEYIFGAIVIFILLIGFFGIRQVGIFSNLPQSTPDTPQKRYAKSGLSKNEGEQLFSRLKQLMSDEKLFTESNLTLLQLAKRLKTTPNYLSQLINENSGDNFYAFINNLRIEEFKTRITDPGYANHKLISIAYDCGFNSKSTFNKYFKEHTGQTPTEYLNSLK